MRCRRAQASVELMVILAVSMLALLVVYSLTTTQTLQIQAQQRVQAAQTAADSIALAANDVFFQGTGAKKRIFIILPDDVNASASLISGKEVNYRIGRTDVFSVADANIVGNIPATPGGHYLTLVAHEDYVSIGDTSITASKNSVYLAMSQDSNASTTLTLTNNASTENALVALLKTWNNPAVTFSLSTTSFTLTPGASQTVDFNFASSSSATGNYAGSVKINVDFNVSTADENITLPVNVDVTAAASGGQTAADTNLTIVPSTWKRAINRGTIDTNTFTVCNTSAAAMSTVSFTKTGTASTWVYDINSLSNLNADSCTTKVVTISPPGSLSAQTATGTITGTGSGSTDTIDLTITLLVPSSYGTYSAVSGYDTTDEGETLDSGDLSDVSTSDNTRYTSDSTWAAASGFDDAEYIEFTFNPGVQAGSTIQDVNIVHEYSLNSSATVVARLETWSADTNSWSTVSLTSSSGTTDVTDTLNLFATVNSVNAVNNFKARFQMYISSGTAKKSRQDLIRLGVKYLPP